MKVKIGDLLLVLRDWKYFADEKQRLYKGRVVVVSEVLDGGFRIYEAALKPTDRFNGDGDLFINLTNILKED